MGVSVELSPLARLDLSRKNGPYAIGEGQDAKKDELGHGR